MNEFVEALLSDKKSDVIPEGMDFYGNLGGSWTFEWFFPRMARHG